MAPLMVEWCDTCLAVTANSDHTMKVKFTQSKFCLDRNIL